MKINPTKEETIDKAWWEWRKACRDSHSTKQIVNLLHKYIKLRGWTREDFLTDQEIEPGSYVDRYYWPKGRK